MNFHLLKRRGEKASLISSFALLPVICLSDGAASVPVKGLIYFLDLSTARDQLRRKKKRKTNIINNCNRFLQKKHFAEIVQAVL